MKKLFIALVLPALLAGCSKDSILQKTGSGGVLSFFWTQEAQVLTVISMENQPIAGAQILIGESLDAPFKGNFLTTNDQGQVTVPAGWTSAQPITAQAPGYVRSSYMAQEPGALTLKLRRQLANIQPEVRGKTSGLPIVEKDGFVDFGLVMPAFTKFDMLAFDINRVISPQFDKVSVMGYDISIPANIALPRQNEQYALFTITLDKPIYRIYYGQQGINRVFAARGRFPFKSTVDSIRKGIPFYELINDFTISGGAIRDIEITSNQTVVDMPTRELNFTESKTVVAPQFSGQELFVAIGVSNQSGYLIPTDIKKMSPGQRISLNNLPGSEHLALAVLKNADEMKRGGDRMSTTLLPFTNGLAPTMLPLIPDPTISGDEVMMPRVNPITGVNPIATYSILSKEEEVIQGPAKVKVFTPQWEVYATNWIDRLKLPQWPQETNAPGKKRWEVNFVGSQNASQSTLGPAIIEAATHVTHSSVTF